MGFCGWADRRRPAHCRTHSGRRLLLRKLVRFAAQVNHAYYDGATPLLKACEQGLLEIAVLLLDKEAAVDLASNDGARRSRPMPFAPLRDAVAVASPMPPFIVCRRLPLLLPAPIASWRSRPAARRFVHPKARLTAMLQHLLLRALRSPGVSGGRRSRMTCDVRIAPRRGRSGELRAQVTPLYAACQKGHVKLAKLLLTRGATAAMCKPGDGASPLHCACELGDLEMVRERISAYLCVSLRISAYLCVSFPRVVRLRPCPSPRAQLSTCMAAAEAGLASHIRWRPESRCLVPCPVQKAAPVPLARAAPASHRRSRINRLCDFPALGMCAWHARPEIVPSVITPRRTLTLTAHGGAALWPSFPPLLRRSSTAATPAACTERPSACPHSSCAHVLQVRILLERQADPNRLRSDGNSPFVLAVQRGHAEVTRAPGAPTCALPSV